MNPTPANYIPLTSSDFIGEARRIAQMLEARAEEAVRLKNGPIKMLFYGAAGIGKTRLVEMFSTQIAGHSCCIESVNGRNVSIDLVRRWQESAHYRPLYGLFTVRIVNELDVCPPAAQDAMLRNLSEG